MLIVPTAALPPAMPFTFQITAVFEVFFTAAVNCLVRPVRTVALAGVMLMLTAGAATTSIKNALDDVPSGAVTTTGTDVFGAAAVPVAESCVDDPTVVGSAWPSNETMEPLVKPVPATVIVNAPLTIGDGVTEEMLGGGMIETAALPLAVGAAVLVARTVTVDGLGTIAGAAYKPAASIVPATASPPLTPLTLHVTLFGAPVTAAVNS